jgi:hypothetical protein
MHDRISESLQNNITALRVSYESKGYKVQNQQCPTYSDAAAKEVQHHCWIKPSIDTAATRNICITQTMKNGIQMA